MSTEPARNDDGKTEQELWAALEGQTGGERASTLLDLADFALGNNEFDQALSMTEAAIDAAANSESEQVLARARGLRGVALFGLERFEESAAAHLDAAALLERYDNLEDTSLAYFNASWSLEMAGILGRALECADTSIAVAEQLGEPEGLLRGYLQRADVLEKLGDRHDELLQSLSNARQAARQAQDARSVLRVDDRVASIFTEDGDHKAAVSLLTDCLAVAESIDEDQAAYFSFRLGKALRMNDDIEGAATALQRALQHNLAHEALHPLAATYFQLAMCEARRDNMDDAFRYVLKARAHFDVVGADEGLREADELRAIWLHGAERYDEAIEVNRLLVEVCTDTMRFMARARLADNYRCKDDFEAGLEWSTPEPEEPEEFVGKSGWLWREAVRAMCLERLGRSDEARAIAALCLAGDLSNASALVQATFHELRGDALAEADPAAARTEWAHAIALYLAGGLHLDAKRLSEAFLPSTAEAQVQ